MDPAGTSTERAEIAACSGHLAPLSFHREPAQTWRGAACDGPVAEARINPDGSDETNAVVGETKIAINCREPDVQEGGVRQELVPGKSIVPTKYGSPETSELKYTIIPGEDTYDIKL